MKQYLDLLEHIVNNGVDRGDRTGTGTRSVFGYQCRFDLRKGFPAVTTKKLAWRAMVGELLWFLEGSGDERRLAEITHGDPEGKVTIWTPNALAPYWKPKAKFEGDLGRVYGVQWRSWTHTAMTNSATSVEHEDGSETHFNAKVKVKVVDQIAELIAGIKTDPYSRRHMLNAWNAGELDNMALPPCHVMSQFYVANGRLSCQMYQRSADVFLGVPFNIASYALLTHMIAQVCDLAVGEFILTIGDAHIYNTHMAQVHEQLTREPMTMPTLWINPAVKDINSFTMDDFKLIDYRHHATIAAPMAV